MKVIQIGYGYWGANVARNLVNSPKFELVALCESDAERLARAMSVLPENVQKLNEFSEIITSSEIDAVVIVTQTEYSFDIAMTAMEHNKHVFMEKPIATTVERAGKLKDKAREKGVILHCDHIMLFHPVIRYIKNMIDTGEIGDLMYFDVSRLNLGPIRKDINAMLDLAVHDLAVLDYLTSGKAPVALSAYGEKFHGEQESLTYLTLKYDGFIAHIKSSWVSPLKERRVMIAGTKKMVIFDDMKAEKLTIYDCGIDVKQGSEYGEYEFLTRTGDIFIPNIPFEDSLRNSLEHFAQCAIDNVQSRADGEQSLRVMKILEKAQEKLKKQ